MHIAHLLLAILAASPDQAVHSAETASAKSESKFAVWVSDHFIVRSQCPDVGAEALAVLAEQKRNRLAEVWLKDVSNKSSEDSRCQVIVHGTKASYLKAVGEGGNLTSGSTLIRFNRGRVISRRIDLLAEDAERPFETIGHEIVHVIFAERFPKTAAPRWAEEGAALLADSDSKRFAHRRDFRSAVRDGQAFGVDELVRMNDYPHPGRVGAFYGQSLVLVEFLTALGEPGDFVRFVDASLEQGHDAALKEVYGISSASQLETLWQERAINVALRE